MGPILTWCHFALVYLSTGSDFYGIKLIDSSGIIQPHQLCQLKVRTVVLLKTKQNIQT